MTVAKMRPTFELRLPLAFDETVKQVGEVLEHPEWKGTSLFFGNYAELHIPKSELRYWSPHLSLYFDGNQEETHVLGRFAPRQEVWTFVCVVYLALAFTAFFSLMYTYSLWLLGEFTWFGIVPPLAIGGIGLLYIASRIGQNWSSDQIITLKTDCNRLFEKILPESMNDRLSH